MQSCGAGEIEVRLVDRNHFDNGRKCREDRGDAVAPLAVLFVMAVQENCVRAKPSRGAQRHRGVDAIFPRFVTRSGDDAALVGTASHNNRFAAQLRAIEQFHRHEKRIHVHMEDRCCRLRRPLIERAMLGSKTRQVRHGPSLLSPHACNNSDLAVLVELEWIR